MFIEKILAMPLLSGALTVCPLGFAFIGHAEYQEYLKDDLRKDAAAIRAAFEKERIENAAHMAIDDEVERYHSACVDTCLSLDYDTENRDGPQFAYSCIGHGRKGFTCEWTNLDENRKPKKPKSVVVRR